MLKGFKDFIMRGNVVDLAIAVILGAAFSEVVKAFVNILMSLIGKFGGLNQDFGSWQPGGLPLGAFLNAVIGFLIVAAVLYFAIVMPLNKLAERRARGQEPITEPPSEEVALLTEIRDALQTRR